MTAGPDSRSLTGQATRSGLTLTVGPPASGKTRAMVSVARDACAAGDRVWWIALPHQRAYVFRRATDGGVALLGLEVMSAQQAYYRVLSAVTPSALRPLLVGTARIVQVAEVLQEVTGQVPTPGEAKLFAAGIAEAKRYEVPPGALAARIEDAEAERLARVYRGYQSSLHGFWDYDDVRSAAARLVEDVAASSVLGDDRARAAAGLPDVLIVDGWRELGPLDWRFLEGMARYVTVDVALPEAPDGMVPDTTLEPLPAGTRVERYGAVNPVEEARLVLRSLKRDLGGGLDPLELAVVAPRTAGDALIALADEYGVPFMDERGAALADTPAGRTLLDLLELPDTPTPARLLAVPELAPVATLAMRLGVTGGDALARVAESVGLKDRLASWQERLSDVVEPVAWTRALLDDVLPLTQPELPRGFADSVMAAAQHASRLGGGAGFRAWLAALLRDVRAPRDPRGGVALLTADLASGRRFARCYVMGATVGAYGAGEREDYFVPDERRSEPPSAGTLPRRFAGGDAIVIAELLTRGETTVITAASAGTDGKLVPDERLVGDPDDLPPLPELPAGSRLELRDTDLYTPAFRLEDPGALAAAYGPGLPDAEWLRAYGAVCAFRAWGEKVVLPQMPAEDITAPAPDDVADPERDLKELLTPAAAEGAEWFDLVRELGRHATLTPDRFELLLTEYPWAAPWLEAHRQTLLSLSWRPVVREAEDGRGYEARVHAGRRDNAGRTATLYRFVEPAPPDWDGRSDGWRWARDKLRHRWTEYLVMHRFLTHRTQPARHVEVVVWPVLGDPITVERSSKDYTRARVEEAVRGVASAWEKILARDVAPSPGFWCGDCRLFYVCRRGQRE